MDCLAPVIAGPFVGSFLGVLIRRLPVGESVAVSRSRCDSCRARLGVRDLVPLLSFILSRGHCRRCGSAIAAFNPAIELAASAVALSVVPFACGAAAWAWCVLGWGLLALAWIDWEWLILPDVLTLPLIVAGIAMGGIDPSLGYGERSLGALLGYASFSLLAWVYRAVRRRDGLGGGDAKLLAVAGSWLGPASLPNVVMIAAMGALVWTLGRSVAARRKVSDEPIPFGPFLALGIWLVLLAGA